MDYSKLILTVNEGIAVITLNRPEALNALNRTMVDELDEIIDKVAIDHGIKAVVIGGEKNFAAGADIKNMVQFNPEMAKDFSFKDTFMKIEQLVKPTVAVISGFALGGGLELALACDFRIAGKNAKMGLPEINLGIFPGAGGTQRLPRLVGASRAKELIFTGSIINADQALQYGLVNKVAEDPMDEALKLAEILAKKPAVAIKLAKQCINLAFDVDVKTGMEFEAVAWGSTFATEDQKEGMTAFLEKRKAVFQGK